MNRIYAKKIGMWLETDIRPVPRHAKQRGF